MGRKKTERPELPATGAEPAANPRAELKVVRLELPREYHRRFRIMAAQHDTTMAILARKIVTDFIDRESKPMK